MKYKYATQIKGTGRRQTPELWKSGPDELEHDKYYAWAKHKAQAKFRNEEHTLTWEEWKSIWTNDLFEQRGRGADSLCLMQQDIRKGWHVDNVSIITRREHLKRAREYRAKQ